MQYNYRNHPINLEKGKFQGMQFFHIQINLETLNNNKFKSIKKSEGLERKKKGSRK